MKNERFCIWTRALPLFLGLLLGIPGCGARSSLYLDDSAPDATTTTTTTDACPTDDDSCVGGACKPTACAGKLGFPNPPLTSVPGGSHAMAVADFDGDGEPDLAVSTWFDSTLSVFLGQGNGVFIPGEVIDTVQGTNSFAAADLDGDGKPDLAVRIHDGVLVLRNNGDGTFASAVTYEAKSQGSIVAADLNGDGRADLALDGPSAQVLLNNGDGTLSPAIDYGIEGGSIRAADLSGDGKPELTFVTETGVTVLSNQGDGTFGAVTQYDTEVTFSSIVAADLNSDGKPDLVGVEKANSSGKAGVSVLLHQGDGTLSSPLHYDTNGDPLAVVAVDLNSDGHPEIVVLRSSTVVDVLLNQGNGTFAVAVGHDLQFYGEILATADVNSDGHPDLAVLGDGESPAGEDAVAVFLGRADGTFEQPVTYPSGIVRNVAAADLDGDGQPDIVTDDYEGLLKVFLNEGGTLGAPTSYAPISVEAFEATDLNGDGRADLAVMHAAYVGGGVSVLLNQGDGTFTDPVNVVEGGEGIGFVTGDMNGDGATDLVINEFSYDEPGFRLFLNGGNASFADPLAIATDEHPEGITARDLNGDGETDLAYVHCAGATDPGCRVRVLLNEGNASFAPELVYPIDSLYDPANEQIEAVDLNGDCIPDLVVQAEWHGVHVLLNQGDGTFAASAAYATDTASTAMAIADLNGDERPDLAVGGAWHFTHVLLNQGDGTFGPVSVYPGKPGPSGWIAAADLNGDGRGDILRPAEDRMAAPFSVCLP